MKKLTCDVCRTTFDITDKYGTNRCPSCGQVYKWIEGYQMRLTAQQLEALRNTKTVAAALVYQDRYGHQML